MTFGEKENVEFLLNILPILGYSTLCGGIIGFERARRGSPAGMKTQVFICVGSALYTVCAITLAKTYGGDAGRLIAQIVSGVGFLGAGTIMARDRIIGLTTAAIIWVMAGLGIMIGMGYGPASVAITLGMFVAVKIISAIETKFVPGHEVKHPTPDLNVHSLESVAMTELERSRKKDREAG